MILSRSRRTRDPSSLIKCSQQAAAEFQSQEAPSRTGFECSLNFQQQQQQQQQVAAPTLRQRSDFFPEQQQQQQQDNDDNSRLSKIRSYRNSNYSGDCLNSSILHVAALEASFFKQDKAPLPRKLKKQQQEQQKQQQHSQQQGLAGFNDLRRSRSLPIVNGGHAKCNSRNAANCEAVADEKWAGPAYSKSPPPSSLPFPKFSVQPMRSLSMDLDLAEEQQQQQLQGGCLDTTFATQDLKRILNLDEQVAV